METKVPVQTLETPTETTGFPSEGAGQIWEQFAFRRPPSPHLACEFCKNIPPSATPTAPSAPPFRPSSPPFVTSVCFSPPSPPIDAQEVLPPVDAGLQQQHQRRRSPSPSAAPPSEALQRRRPPIPLQRRCHGPGVRHGGRGRPRGHGPGAPRPWFGTARSLLCPRTSLLCSSILVCPWFRLEVKWFKWFCFAQFFFLGCTNVFRMLSAKCSVRHVQSPYVQCKMFRTNMFSTNQPLILYGNKYVTSGRTNILSNLQSWQLIS